MLKKKKGFTLVELLAVIVILAIILAIAVPGISGIINNSRRSAFEADVKMIITGIEYQILQSTIDTDITTPAVGDILANIDDYGADPTNYTAAEITSLDPITVTITSSANSEFGAWTATGATKASVTATPVTTP
ncbi:MAG TPA: prepilin-type N-terminal cleavage/methylation domain-containing protein [Mollicutes bacterium]|nr:prepilin-type N-terminal cleavage/methylation domain-containing protein [Mollicutes bacterium]